MVDIVLGFDFGIKRIGIAMGNTLTGQAQPLSVIKAIDNATRFKLIGELIVGSSRAVSIVPADIAEELVRIAGVAVVPYSFEWTLPPIAMFMRAQGPRRTAEQHFAAALRATCKSLYGHPTPDATNPPRGWV